MLGTLLITVLVAGIVWWLIDIIPIIDATFKRIAKGLLILFVVIWIVKVTGLIAWLNNIG